MLEIENAEKRYLQRELFKLAGIVKADPEAEALEEDYQPVFSSTRNLSSLRKLAVLESRKRDSATQPISTIAKDSELTPDEQIFQQELARANGENV